jgi:hypothetical protein
MLLPEKHITLAESLIGLGGVLLDELRAPQTIDRLYDVVKRLVATAELPAHHGLDDVLLATLFLYSVGAIELTDAGGVQRCVS